MNANLVRIKRWMKERHDKIRCCGWCYMETCCNCLLAIALYTLMYRPVSSCVARRWMIYRYPKADCISCNIYYSKWVDGIKWRSLYGISGNNNCGLTRWKDKTIFNTKIKTKSNWIKVCLEDYIYRYVAKRMWEFN